MGDIKMRNQQMKKELQAYKYLCLFVLGLCIGWICKGIQFLNGWA